MTVAVTPPAMVMMVPVHLREIAGTDVASHRSRERSDRGRVRGARKRRESQSRNRKHKCRSDHSVLLKRASLSATQSSPSPQSQKNMAVPRQDTHYVYEQTLRFGASRSPQSEQTVTLGTAIEIETRVNGTMPQLV
jgi:hypothetical protein